MGTPVPDDRPIIIPDKWYACHFDNFFDLTPATGCDQAYFGRIACCLIGKNITGWLAGGGECDETQTICHFPIGMAQRLIAIHGPYDGEFACADDI